MRRLWFFCGCAVALTLGGGVARAADVPDGAPQVTFRFERAGVPVPHYRLTVGEDGSAVYEGEEAPLPQSRFAPPSTGPVELKPFRTETRISSGVTRKIFEMTGTLKQFHVNCSTKAKNIADTGAKTLEYKGPEGAGECSYNYSDNKTVTELTDLFEAIAQTMNEGRELDHLHRYDRLGLDAAIQTLAHEAAEGRAQALETIAGTLRSIAGDTEVMERVRVQASKLLSLLPAEMQRTSQ